MAASSDGLVAVSVTTTAGRQRQLTLQGGRRSHFAKSWQCVKKRLLKAEIRNAYTAPPALQEHLGAISA